MSAMQKFPWGVPNPFYIISAALFVHGTVLPSEEPFTPLTQVTLSLGYVALCTLTTVWLIRRLGRWDDARSLVVIVTGMFLAVSLELDDGLALLGTTTRLAVAVGVWGFSVVMFEVIAQGGRLGLPKTFRGAFHVQWALLLIYPAIVSGDPLTARYQITAYGLLAAACWLFYWPALGRSRPAASAGWTHPLCPWTLPTLTGLATITRWYFLAVAYDPVLDVQYDIASGNWSTILGLDMAVPMLLALSVLLIESGRRSTVDASERTAAGLIMSLIAAVTVFAPVDSTVAVGFRDQLATVIPLKTLLSTLVLAVATWHVWRGVVESRGCWAVTSLVVAYCLPSSGEPTAVAFSTGLLIAATAFGLAYGFRNQRLFHWCSGTAAAWLLASRHLPAELIDVPWQTHDAIATLLLTVGSFRMSSDDQPVIALLASCCFTLMLWPATTGIWHGDIEATLLAVATAWVVAFGPFVYRDRDFQTVCLYLMIALPVLFEWLRETLYDERAGVLRVRAVTLLAAGATFGCGLLFSHAKTRRETRQVN